MVEIINRTASMNERKNHLYRMDEKWIHQPWYDPNSVFELVKVSEIALSFGVDCVWKNVETGFNLNHWYNTMRKLSTQESRAFKINLIIED